jgi:hypothetical protein
MKNSEILGNNLEFLYCKSSFSLVQIFNSTIHNIHTRNFWCIHCCCREVALTIWRICPCGKNRRVIWAPVTTIKTLPNSLHCSTHLTTKHTHTPITTLTGIPSPAVTSNTSVTWHPIGEFLYYYFFCNFNVCLLSVFLALQPIVVVFSTVR